MPKDQSVYRQVHSTEMAILRIYSDIVNAIANGQIALLCLLELLAASSTVDHGILTFAVLNFPTGQVLAWL